LEDTLQNLRLGIVGYGDAALSFTTAANFHQDWQLVAVGGRNMEKAHRFAGDFGVEARTVNDMANSEDIDVIAVTTPPGVHLDDTLLSIEGGKHIIVEKPFALTVRDCDRMITAADERGVHLMVGQTMRYYSGAMRIRKIIEIGELGALLMIEETASFDYFGPKRSGWQIDPALSGGGVVMNPVIHLADRLRYYTGAEIDSVHAKLGASKPGYDIEGHVQVYFEFKASEVTAALTLYGYGQTHLDRTMLFFEKGVIQHDFTDHRIAVYSEGNKVRVERPDPMPYGPGRIVTGYVQQLVEFADTLRENNPNRSDGCNGRANVAACLAILRSAETGTPVKPV
jgi:predicted dehydrogenase